MTKKQARIRALRFSHVVICDPCRTRFTWSSPPPDPKKAVYICQKCKGEMRVETVEDMSQEEAERVDRYRGRFNGEACPACEATTGHRVHAAADVVAFFLFCSCGEELREIEPEELDEAERSTL